MADPIDRESQSWGSVTRRLRAAGERGQISDADLFGDDPLAPKRERNSTEYLGHFAKDEVAEEGHNSGAPRQHEIKRCYDGDTAKRGYKVIPGNVTDGYVNKKVREEIANVTTTSLRYGGPIPAFGYGPKMDPPTKAPLRKAARTAKAKAGRGVGEATLRTKRH